MTVHIVLLINGGIPDDPEVFATLRAAEGRFAALAREHHLDVEHPYDDDYELYLWPEMDVSDSCPTDDTAEAGARSDPAPAQPRKG